MIEPVKVESKDGMAVVMLSQGEAKEGLKAFGDQCKPKFRAEKVSVSERRLPFETAFERTRRKRLADRCDGSVPEGCLCRTN